MLCTLRDRIENANDGINAGNSVLGKISEALRMDWLRQLGFELKSLLYWSIAINVATYQAVIRNQTPLPSRLERGLIEEPVILEDAIGRIAPVHLQFVTSWDAFDAVLEIRFRGMQGHRKITQRQYELQDRVSGKDIEKSRSWDRAFLPGQRVEMSMLFHSDAPMDTSSAGTTCPGCHTSASSSTDAETQCENCLIWFKRISVMEETASCQSRVEHCPESLPVFNRTLDPIPSMKQKKSDEMSDDEEEDIKDFKRVRIMLTPRRTKNAREADHTGQSNPGGYKPRLIFTSWPDEGTTCFLVETKGTFVARRIDNHMINGTRLLRVANVPREKRNDILNSERVRHDVKLAPSRLRGVWIPYERALKLANQENITEQVYPLFVQDTNALLLNSLN
jgi:hypothetical protein